MPNYCTLNVPAPSSLNTSAIRKLQALGNSNNQLANHQPLLLNLWLSSPFASAIRSLIVWCVSGCLSCQDSFAKSPRFQLPERAVAKGLTSLSQRRSVKTSQSGCSVITCNYLSLHGQSSFLIVVGSDQMQLVLTRFATSCSFAVVIFCQQNLNCDQVRNILVTLIFFAFCYKHCCLA